MLRKYLVCLVAWGLLGVWASRCVAQQSADPVKIALTFDDLPETSDVPANSTRMRIATQLIDELKAGHAPVVYGFINAGTLDDPEVKGVLEHWREAGNLLGNHTFTHYNLDDKPLAVFETDIKRNEPVLRALMAGEDWHWFRYPFLSEGATLEKRNGLRMWLKDNGYKIAEVTVNFDDDAWNDTYARCVARRDETSIAKMKVMYVDAATESLRFSRARSQQMFRRDISYVMLLHMGGFAPVMLPRLLELLNEKGYTLVTLPEAESDAVYQMDPKTANDGGTLLDDLMEASELEDGPHLQTPTAQLAGMCKPAPRRRSVH